LGDRLKSFTFDKLSIGPLCTEEEMGRLSKIPVRTPLGPAVALGRDVIAELLREKGSV